jgi:hypothetical protein
MTEGWGGVFGAQPPVEDDEGAAALIAMLPEQHRQMGAPMMRGMLANVKSQLSEADYQTYCASLKRAYEAHIAGDYDTARQIIESYGLPYDMLAAIG